jgi:hypothetical protein
LRELDRVVLTRELPEHGLCEGDVGTVVFVYPDGEAYEVEFTALGGDTLAVATVPTSQVRAAAPNEIAHARAIPALSG